MIDRQGPAPSPAVPHVGAAPDPDARRRRPDAERRRAAAACLRSLLPELRHEAEAALGRAETVGFLARLELWFPDLHLPLDALYGDRHDTDALAARLVRAALAAAAARPAPM